MVVHWSPSVLEGTYLTMVLDPWVSLKTHHVGICACTCAQNPDVLGGLGKGDVMRPHWRRVSVSCSLSLCVCTYSLSWIKKKIDTQDCWRRLFGKRTWVGFFKRSTNGSDLQPGYLLFGGNVYPLRWVKQGCNMTWHIQMENYKALCSGIRLTNAASIGADRSLSFSSI